jgi:DSF synthase
MILSGKVYTAEELYEQGVVDVLAAPGKGIAAVHQYIAHQHTRFQGVLGLDKVIEQFNPVSYEELMGVIDVWVDTALQLSDKNIRLMSYLVQAQNRRWAGAEDRGQEVVVSAVG